MVKDKGTLQGTGKITWHWQVFLAFRPGTISTRYQGKFLVLYCSVRFYRLQLHEITFWYCTAQYASTGCNCMRSFVVKLQPQRNKEIEVD
jgi:hypothetical protein